MTRTRSRRRPALKGLVPALLVAASAPAAAEESADGLRSCESGVYRVGYTSNLSPIEINAIHTWVLHVETAAGAPVPNAEIRIEGGMPEHDHGLPTRPQVTEYLGDGDYRIGGMRFHMNGDWEIEIAIDAAPGRDVCLIPLTL